MTLFPDIEEENKQKRKDDRAKKENIKQHIIENSEMWRPSNGTEGYAFESNFCHKCKHDNPEKKKLCPTLAELYNGLSEDVRNYKDKEVVCLRDSNLNLDDFEKEAV